MMASPLSRELRERNELYPRRLTVRKGDVVLVRRGGFEGHEGKVLDVDLKKMKISVDGVVYQKADNTSIPKPIDPSNVEIIKLDLSDKLRKKKIERALEQSDLTTEEIQEAEEELEAIDSIEIAALEEAAEEEEEEDAAAEKEGSEKEAVEEEGEKEAPVTPDISPEEPATPTEESDIPTDEPATPKEGPDTSTEEPDISKEESETSTEADSSDDQNDNKEGSN